jgi:hypothetical protein
MTCSLKTGWRLRRSSAESSPISFLQEPDSPRTSTKSFLLRRFSRSCSIRPRIRSHRSCVARSHAAFSNGCCMCQAFLTIHAAITSGRSKPTILSPTAASFTKKPSGSIGDFARQSPSGYRAVAMLAARWMLSARTATWKRAAPLLTSIETSTTTWITSPLYWPFAIYYNK